MELLQQYVRVDNCFWQPHYNHLCHCESTSLSTSRKNCNYYNKAPKYFTKVFKPVLSVLLLTTNIVALTKNAKIQIPNA